ncbi:MAG: amino acid permease [Planctomycetes bacterium]|nr:amino acid permease [Planctomycetota bacterium]
MTDSTPTAGLRRVLGPLDATCIVIGAVVGVGIFFNPSQVARTVPTGEMALLAWIVGGLIALAGGLTFAALGAAYPNAGGQYEILKDGFGPLPAFLFVFSNSTVMMPGAIAVISVISVHNLLVALGLEPDQFALTWGLAIVMILALAGANVWGVKLGAGVQNTTVFAKIAALLLVVLIAGVASPKETQAAAAAVPVTAAAPAGSVQTLVVLFAAIVPCFFAYGGWQHGLWMAGEVREPDRNVPRAIIVGMLIVVAVYVGANWAYLHLLGHAGVAGSKTLAADAVAVAWPGFGKRLVAAAVAVSAFGVLNEQLLAGPRLIYRMSLDGRFFRVFSGLHPTRRTPVAAILLLAGLGLLMLLSSARYKKVDSLVDGVVFVDAVFFAATAAAIFVLRRTRPDLRVGGARYGYPIAPALFVLGELGLFSASLADPDKRGVALYGLAWILVGAVLFAGLFRQRRAE